MKNIKELGLETIQLEDQVLLVDNEKLILNGYIQRGAEKPVINTPDFWFDFGTPYRNVIASTKPLEELPLLVIEDEAMLNVLSLIEESKIETESTKLVLIGAYTTGYNKAKETYKFTEEDLRKAMDYASQITNNRLKYIDDYIQSLTKKELWIEVDYDYEEHPELVGNPKEEWYFPKITNNQIKAVWK